MYYCKWKAFEIRTSYFKVIVKMLQNYIDAIWSNIIESVDHWIMNEYGTDFKHQVLWKTDKGCSYHWVRINIYIL